MQFAIVTCLLSVLFICDAEHPKMFRRREHVSNEYLVVMRNRTMSPPPSMSNFMGQQGQRGRNSKYLRRAGMMRVNVQSETELTEMLNDPDISYIEQVVPVRAACSPASYYTPSDQWGLDRVDQPNLPLDRKFNVDESNPTGEDVIIYVIDSGVYADHPDFNGRARRGPVFTSWENNTEDLNGHGTHCAGIAASTTYGVAKTVKVVGVKGLDRHAEGSTGTVGQGVEWVMEDHARRGGRGVAKSVISLSVGGAYAQAFNDLVRMAYLDGIVVVAAAGNFERNADQFSPSSAPEAIVVGAIRWEDKRIRYSNWGPLVDIHAPGADIKSTWIPTASRKRRSTRGRSSSNRKNTNNSSRRGNGSGGYQGTFSGPNGTCICEDCKEDSARRRYLRRNPHTCQTTTTATPATDTTTTTASTTSAPTTTPVDDAPTKFLWGTSMACPHVAGAVALYLQSQPAGVVPTPDDADAWLKRHATYTLDENFPGEPGITTKAILNLPNCNNQ